LSRTLGDPLTFQEKRIVFPVYAGCTPGKLPSSSLFFFGETGILFYEKQKIHWSGLLQKSRPNRAYSAFTTQSAALLDFITECALFQGQ